MTCQFPDDIFSTNANHLNTNLDNEANTWAESPLAVELSAQYDFSSFSESIHFNGDFAQTQPERDTNNLIPTDSEGDTATYAYFNENREYVSNTFQQQSDADVPTEGETSNKRKRATSLSPSPQPIPAAPAPAQFPTQAPFPPKSGGALGVASFAQQQSNGNRPQTKRQRMAENQSSLGNINMTMNTGMNSLGAGTDISANIDSQGWISASKTIFPSPFQSPNYEPFPVATPVHVPAPVPSQTLPQLLPLPQPGVQLGGEAHSTESGNTLWSQNVWAQTETPVQMGMGVGAMMDMGYPGWMSQAQAQMHYVPAMGAGGGFDASLNWEQYQELQRQQQWQQQQQRQQSHFQPQHGLLQQTNLVQQLVHKQQQPLPQQQLHPQQHMQPQFYPLPLRRFYHQQPHQGQPPSHYRPPSWRQQQQSQMPPAHQQQNSRTQQRMPHQQQQQQPVQQLQPVQQQTIQQQQQPPPSYQAQPQPLQPTNVAVNTPILIPVPQNIPLFIPVPQQRPSSSGTTPVHTYTAAVSGPSRSAGSAPRPQAQLQPPFQAYTPQSQSQAYIPQRQQSMTSAPAPVLVPIPVQAIRPQTSESRPVSSMLPSGPVVVQRPTSSVTYAGVVAGGAVGGSVRQEQVHGQPSAGAPTSSMPMFYPIPVAALAPRRAAVQDETAQAGPGPQTMENRTAATGPSSTWGMETTRENGKGKGKGKGLKVRDPNDPILCQLPSKTLEGNLCLKSLSNTEQLIKHIVDEHGIRKGKNGKEKGNVTCGWPMYEEDGTMSLCENTCARDGNYLRHVQEVHGGMRRPKLDRKKNGDTGVGEDKGKGKRKEREDEPEDMGDGHS